MLPSVHVELNEESISGVAPALSLYDWFLFTVRVLWQRAARQLIGHGKYLYSEWSVLVDISSDRLFGTCSVSVRPRLLSGRGGPSVVWTSPRWLCEAHFGTLAPPGDREGLRLSYGYCSFSSGGSPERLSACVYVCVFMCHVKKSVSW